MMIEITFKFVKIIGGRGHRNFGKNTVLKRLMQREYISGRHQGEEQNMKGVSFESGLRDSVCCISFITSQ